MLTCRSTTFMFVVFVAVVSGAKERLQHEPDIPVVLQPWETKVDTTIAPATNTTSTPITTPPITTPAPPITTSAPPKPTPAPDTGMWSFANETNVTCIVLQAAVQWNVSYPNEDGKRPYTLFNLPVAETKVFGGDCGNLTQSISLRWPTTNTSQIYNNMTVYFKKNVTSSKYVISAMVFDFSLNSTNFPNALAKNETIHLELKDEIFSVPVTRSYRCSHLQSFNLTLPDQQENRGTVTLSKLQEQAFLAEKGHSFASAMDCDNSDVPDAVPIGVGIALAVAVLLVLIGYLIGRRRSQARGYLSM